MFGTAKILPAAAAAAGLVALAALVGCGGDRSVASQSAAAFQEAQKKGETFGGAGHSHGHGGATPGGGHEAPDAAPSGEMEHGGHHQALAQAPEHSGHAAPETGGAEHHGPDHAHGGSPATPGGHAGHGAMPPAAPATPDAHGDHSGHGTHGDHGTEAQPQPPAAGHADHAGHSPSPGGVPPAPAAPSPEAPSPGQPAVTLRPDALDAPAASSLLDAQRSAEMAQGMAGGGHGSHGGGTYRHVDVGREPGAAQATPTPSSHEGEHEHASGATESDVAVYVCPMHPEVTSETPGTCPKCGMTLVQRRKG